jgi:hypothetical protein
MTAMKSRLCFLGLVSASLILTGCPEKRRPANSPNAKPASNAPAKAPGGDSGSQATGPLADYAKGLSNSEKKAAEVTGTIAIGQAVQQYNIIEGRFPRTLDELVESRYLPKLPVAPRGKRYVYNPQSGEVTVVALADAAPTPAPEATPAMEATPPPVTMPSIEAAPAPAETPATDAPQAPAPAPGAVSITLPEATPEPTATP